MGAPRRPFQQATPPPLHQTPEFKRSAVLLGLLAVVGVVGFYIANNAEKRAEQDAAKAALAERRYEAPDQGSSATTTEGSPAPLARTPEEEAARQEANSLRLLTLFEGSLNDTKNGDDFIQTSGYRRLLELVARYDTDDFAARTTKWLDRQQLQRDPDSMRGEFVRVRGLVGHVASVRLDRQLHGYVDVRRALVGDGEGEEFETVIIDVLGDLPGDLWREAVDFDCVFYRTVTYKAEGQDKNGRTVEIERTAPYLIARNWRLAETKAPVLHGFFRDHTLTLMVLSGIVIFGTHLILLLVQHRRRLRRRPAPPTQPLV